MKKEEILKLLYKKIKSGVASKQDVKKYFILKKQLNQKLPDTDHVMDKHLTVLSGMKGAEKSIKDKIGKDLKRAEHTYSTIDKVLDRINKRRKEKSLE